ncbi:MAG TPA: FecR domain-containing protein [bacterium]|nr:FecR domain-containing protein [bacterium]
MLFLFLLIVNARVVIAAPVVDTVAKITRVTNDVKLRKAGIGEWVAAKDGMSVKTGDQIKTGSDSSCVVEWSKGNLITVSSFTNIKIDRLEKNLAAGSEKSSLDLWTGKVFAKAKKLESPDSKFEIKTPTAHAGVRGTRFAVGLDADETTTVECFEGVVAVKGRVGGEVMLGGRQKTKVRKNETPQDPVQMDSDDDQSFEALEELMGAMLEIMQPIGNLETDMTPVMVKGRTDQGNTVTVNGQVAIADETGIFLMSVDLTEGVNHIKIEAANKNGKMTTKTRVIKYRKRKGQDNEPEEQDIGLTITSPNNGFVTGESSVSVSGRISPDASVTINGIAATVSSNGTFSATVTLVEGENIINITAGNANASQSVTRTVIKDTTAPLLVISQPTAVFGPDTGGCMLVGSHIQCTVIGQTEPGAVLTINDTDYQVEPDGSFAHTVVLAFDEPTMNIAATDSSGNRATRLLNRVVDRNIAEYLEIEISPSAITANGQDTATVTVHAYNLLREPVDVFVSVLSTGGGILYQNGLVTVGGTAATTFTAGVSSIPNTVTFTATSGFVSTSATLLLNADVPPEH